MTPRTLLLTLALAASPAAFACESLWLSPGGVSEHFGTKSNDAPRHYPERNEMNEAHTGLAFECELPHGAIAVGDLKNSVDQRMRYVSATKRYSVTPAIGVRYGVMGMQYQYTKNGTLQRNTGAFPIVAGELRLGRLGANVVFLPKFSAVSYYSVLFFQIKWQIF